MQSTISFFIGFLNVSLFPCCFASIDYQIATPSIAGKAVYASAYKYECFSDHAPLIIDCINDILS
jgi:hypothetical protein